MTDKERIAKLEKENKELQDTLDVIWLAFQMSSICPGYTKFWIDKAREEKNKGE